MTLKTTATQFITAIGVGGLALLAAAPSSALPSMVGTAEDVVNNLQDAGHHVILEKVGSGPLDQCTVTDMRPGRKVDYRDYRPPTNLRPKGGAGIYIAEYDTVLVSVMC